MPNHCDNTLQVQGVPFHVRNFARDHYRQPDTWSLAQPDPGCGKSTLDFSASVPLPGDRHLTTFHDSGYGWQIANWGTKWNAYDITPDTFPEVLDRIHRSTQDNLMHGSLTFSFSTAWSPPSEWLVRASTKYPDLTFTLRYEESGMAFCGWLVARAGSRIAEHAHDNYPEALLSPDELKLLNDEDTWDEGWEILHDRVQEYLNNISYKDLTFPTSSV